MKSRSFALLPALAVLCACSTHPITGRNQIASMPAVQAYADATFALSSAAQHVTALPCEEACSSAEEIEAFAERVRETAAHLELAAREVSPELFERIGAFRVEVDDRLGVGSGSTAGGRVALGSGLAMLQPTDTVIAFLLAREMAHVIARHSEENSGASLVLSALGLLLPGFHVIARWVATAVGSGALQSTWAAQQQREADEIAVRLLELSGLPVLRVARSLESGVRRAQLPENAWGARYADSAQRVALMAASGPGAIGATAAGN